MHFHFISGNIKLGLITVCILYLKGEFDHWWKCTVWVKPSKAFYFKTGRSLNKLTVTEHSQPLF